jgi:hypothetical protein
LILLLIAGLVLASSLQAASVEKRSKEEVMLDNLVSFHNNLSKLNDKQWKSTLEDVAKTFEKEGMPANAANFQSISDPALKEDILDLMKSKINTTKPAVMKK